MEQQDLLAAVAAVVVLLLLCIGGAAIMTFKSRPDAQSMVPQQQVQEERGGGGRRLAAGARRRRMQARVAEQQEAEEGEEEEDERPQQQQQQFATRKDAYEEKRRRKDEQREAAEAAAEQAAIKKEEARQAAEDAEAARWLGKISVEKEGHDASESEEQQGVLQAFIEYIKERKTVVLEDLAAEFGMRVQEVISRVQSLESMGKITGVMDDRGKFIYISLEEMAAVAEFIKRKGRVSIAELAAKSNTFIDLEEKEGPPAELEVLDLDLGAEPEEPETQA